MEVEITLKIDESYAEAIQQFAENHGGQEIIISKPLKFEDLGLAPIEDGKYQCLACSKTYPSKGNAARHYKNTHISRVEPTTQCPRCSEEMARTKLNSHMDQKHGLKNFKQLLKRSFQPNESGKLGPKEKIQKTADMDFSDPISLRNANAGFVK